MDLEELKAKLLADCKFENNKNKIFDKNNTNKLNQDEREDITIIAYFMSRFIIRDKEKDILQQLGEYKSVSHMIKVIASIFNYNANSLSNIRDSFDPYFDNGRGWLVAKKAIKKSAEKYSTNLKIILLNK